MLGVVRPMPILDPFVVFTMDADPDHTTDALTYLSHKAHRTEERMLLVLPWTVAFALTFLIRAFPLLLSQKPINDSMTSCARKTQEDINNEWNAMAGEWDDVASGYRNSFAKLLWEQVQLEPSAKRVVVDFGCGTGLLIEKLRKQSPSSEFICIDAAPAMIRVLQEKIQSFGWEGNVRAHCVALARAAEAEEGIQKDLANLKGKVDLIVASSVMSFVPSQDLPETMKQIGELLKDDGLFCHSDWPITDDSPDGFDEEKATKMYAMGGLQMKSSVTTKIGVGSDEGVVFIGVAAKKSS